MTSLSRERRLPTWSDVRPLLGGRPARQTRLQRATSVADLRELARRRTPKAVFDYTDGGAEDERSMQASRRAYDDVVFHPRVLRDVSCVDTSTSLLGRRASMPLVLAPTGFTRMMHAAGEPAVAAAAARAGTPYTLSTMGTTSIEALAERVPTVDRWFQLYVWQDRSRSQLLIDRAADAGYRTLVLTADVPVAGARLRDVRNGLTIPPRLTARTLAGLARYPRWWGDLLTSGPLSFASVSDSPADLASIINGMFDPAVGWADIDWLRRSWPGTLVVKGLQRVDDACRAVEAGADALVLSNHGGRQLDRAVAPLLLLPAVAAAVGDQAEIYLDGGVRSGADIAAAVALGAHACLIGRPYLYGLMAGGELGVDRCLDLLREELTRTMALLGARTVAQLDRQLVTLDPAPLPVALVREPATGAALDHPGKPPA